MTSHLTYLRAKHKTHFIIKLLKMDLRHFQSHLKRFYLSSLLKIANELFDSKGYMVLKWLLEKAREKM
ncbi:uncharacterized protein isoform X3 [Rhodnius prolixus]|uniref:uncharacterized protein isoform X3 n=1 Tax=Rhodnius prolixus TaxID=13249 RepID=UPI003D18D4B9